jgi:hypothetical protein
MCDFCQREAIQQVSVIVDAEPDPESGGMCAVWGKAWVCDEHLMQYDEREGLFERRKHD